VGLDTVVARMREVGASVTLTTVPGRGTAFTIRLPTRLGIVRALVTRVGDEHYVLPLTHVTELAAWDAETAGSHQGRNVILVHGERIPAVDLRRLVQYHGDEAPARRPAVVMASQGQRVALLADAVQGQVDAVVQSLDRPQGLPRWITGATILEDGQPALLLDLASVI
jgi:two-component system chemotaxis sensor kinase CheA